ncbi:MAG: hypothetical protein ACREDV_09365 [Methylocella sp.]
MNRGRGETGIGARAYQDGALFEASGLSGADILDVAQVLILIVVRTIKPMDPQVKHS